MSKKEVIIRTPSEIEKIAASGKVVADFFEYIRPFIKSGIATIEIDLLADQFASQRGGVAVFKEVPNYRHATCISFNEQIVHGIPGSRLIKEGDLVKIDYGFKKDGYIGDSCQTFVVGKIPKRTQELVDVTRKALDLGIEQALHGNRIGDIGHAIQRYVERHGFSVVREYVGHGVGTELHEAPSVPHFGQKGTGTLLKAGMVIAIEPMINMGTWKSRVLADGWTVVTMDGKCSAQFEHTIAILSDGPRILTK
ncbi:MAG: type I methionyl aminopeptidase [Candidatus Margulisiibacteriota bacterium]